MNQGEVINRQNLSYSMYSRESYPKDSLVDSSMFYERSPCVGISKSEFHKYRGKKLLSPIEKDKPLTSGHFEILRKNTREEILEARNLMLSIPVRFHDIKLAYQTFDLDCYEFHLSFSDFESNYNLASIVREKFNYSLHVPDYISSNTLLDIFSNNNETKTRSRSLIDSSIKIAREVQEITGKTVPVVCSLNSSSYVPDFYKVVKEMQIEFEHEGVLFLPQWLPPVAWYFGGSYKIRYMNSLQAASEIKRNSIDICLDYSHLLLTCNFFDLNLVEIFEMLQMNSRHFHLAGAEGIDSEGTSVGALGEIESSVLSRILHQAGIKVLERWQGHLNDFSGFVNEISSLLALKQ
jgi:hypothetical protein